MGKQNVFSLLVAMWWGLEEGGAEAVLAEVSHLAMGRIPYPAHGPTCLPLIGTHQQYTRTGEWEKSGKYTWLCPQFSYVHLYQSVGLPFAGILWASLRALSSGPPHPVCWQSAALGQIWGKANFVPFFFGWLPELNHTDHWEKYIGYW